MRLQTPIPNSNGVQPGGTATWDLPIGRRYHQLDIEYSGVTLAQMTEIRYIINGEVFHRLSATERDTLNGFDRKAMGGGILSICFDRDNLYRQEGEELTSIQTGSVDPKSGKAITTFKLEIDLAAGAYTPSIKVTAEQSDNDPGRPGPGLLLRTLKFPKALTTVGENEVSDLPKATEGPEKYVWVNRTFIKSPVVTGVEVMRDNLTVFKRSKALNDRRQGDGVRTPQAGYYVIDPLEEGYDFEAINLYNSLSGKPYQDFRYKTTLSAADPSLVFIVEYIGGL